MKIKELLLTFILVFFSACGAVASVKDNSQDWVNNPPSDDAYYFYGLGRGDDLKTAKSDALSYISSNISVNVASTFNSSVTAQRYGDNEEVIKDIKSDVVSKSKEIEYTNVKILKSKKTDDGYVVLVRVDRKELAQNYKRKLDSIDNEIKTQYGFFQKASPFEKIKIASKIEELLKKTDEIFPLLHTIDKSFNDKPYINRYTNYTKEIKKAKNNLVIGFKYDENSQSLVDLLRDYLSKEGIKFNNNNYDVLIKITTKAKKRKYRSTNEKFANLVFALRKTTITAEDKNGNILSEVVYKTKEGSNLGFEDAIAKTKKYEKKIKQLGVINFIVGNN
jgi:hypothetical protein